MRPSSICATSDECTRGSHFGRPHGVDFHFLHVGQAADDGVRRAQKLRAVGAGGGGQRHVDADAAGFDVAVDLVDQPQVDDVDVKLRVFDRHEDVGDFLEGRHFLAVARAYP